MVCRPVTPAFERERWEDLQLKDVLGYTGNSKPA